MCDVFCCCANGGEEDHSENYHIFQKSSKVKPSENGSKSGNSNDVSGFWNISINQQEKCEISVAKTTQRSGKLHLYPIFFRSIYISCLSPSNCFLFHFFRCLSGSTHSQQRHRQTVVGAARMCQLGAARMCFS